MSIAIWLIEDKYTIKIWSISEEKSGAMNVSAAWDFVDSMLGVDYGYEVDYLLSSFGRL